MKAELPPDERERLLALARYEILDTGAEAAFDSITRLAAHVCNAPTALITLVDETRQWFKSRYGFSTTQTHRDLSFCSHAILGREPLVVNDARLDPRFADNPLVSSDPNIRFYAGVPIVVGGDVAVGTLAVIDYRPRELSPVERDLLQGLARLVESQLELRIRRRDELAQPACAVSPTTSKPPAPTPSDGTVH